MGGGGGGAVQKGLGVWQPLHLITPDELAAVLFPVQISVCLLQNLTSVFSSFRLMFPLMATGAEDYSLRFFLSTHAFPLSHYLTISCTHTHTDAPASRASTYNRVNISWQEHTVDRGPESLSARCRCSSICSAVSRVKSLDQKQLPLACFLVCGVSLTSSTWTLGGQPTSSSLHATGVLL